MSNNRYKPLIFIAAGLLFFAGFLWLLMGIGGTMKEAESSLYEAKQYNAVKQVWEHYANDLRKDQEWRKKVLEKLKGLPLDDNQKREAADWLELPTHLNLVIVPDLSYRIKNAGQIETDKRLLNHIWACFRKRSINNYISQGEQPRKAKDRIVLDITPEVTKKLELTVQDLVFDVGSSALSSIKYLGDRQNKFEQAIADVYATAEKDPRGANYWQYVNHDLTSNFKESDWFEKYDNVLIFITDGYLETSKANGNTDTWYTGTDAQLWQARKDISSGKQTIKSAIASNKLGIKANLTTDLSGWQLLIIEVQEKEGRYGDEELLRQQWYEWLTAAKCNVNEKTFFQSHQIASVKTESVISKFLKVDIQSKAVLAPTIAINDEPADNSVLSNKYDALITQAEQAVKKQDMATAKILLRNASKVRNTNNLPEGERAAALYKTCLSAADLSFSALKQTHVYDDMDIPADYYELASIIRSDEAIQAKLTECRKYRFKATPSSI